MSDSFQCIVDTEVAETEASSAAHAILDWLVVERIVAGTLSECVLGDVGYAPGTSYGKATAKTASTLLMLKVNGLEVITGRTVFDNGGEDFELICSSCGARSNPNREFAAAVDEWFSHKGPGPMPCPACRTVQLITEWSFDPPIAFGNMGLRFWNWPRLSDGFVKDVADRLRHRVVVVSGTL